MSLQCFANGDYVNFGDIVALQTLNTMTLVTWVKFTAEDELSPIFSKTSDVSGSPIKGWELRRNIASLTHTKALYFWAYWSTGAGRWSCPNNSLLINTKYQIVIVYNAGAIGNNPVIYINGVSQTVTRETAPAGAWNTNSGTDLRIGMALGSTRVPVALQEDVRVFSDLKSAADVVTLYAGGVPTSLELNDMNLPFSAPLFYAAHRYPTIPFASTLAGTDFLYDRIGQIQGTPNGAPAGAADFVYGKPF